MPVDALQSKGPFIAAGVVGADVVNAVHMYLGFPWCRNFIHLLIYKI